VTDFAAKAPASAAKLRGGYYTPTPVAAYLARWVSKAGRRLLEPSCGDGAILKYLVKGRGKHVEGVELLPSEAEKARLTAGGKANVHEGDFFRWFTREKRGSWDGVAGNPPYIRFGNWPERDRTLAFSLMEECGLRPTRLTNAWVPFTVGSVLAVGEGGRIGLVLPAELLQVSYAAQLREFLLEELSELNIVSFRQLVFPGILQEVVLVLGIRGNGATRICTAEVNDASGLESINWEMTPAAPALRHDREKWTKYFLGTEQIDDLRWAREDGGLIELGDIARIEVGVVTGRNSFFTMTPSEADERGLSEYCVPLVARSSQVSGLTYDEVDLTKQSANNVRCLLLSVDPATRLNGNRSLQRYVRDGEAAGVDLGYKCRIRKPWWSVPSVWTPEAFMLRQIHMHPLMIANHTDATSTDTVHRVRLRGEADIDNLAGSLINSATFAFAEIIGRSYGGGILELEPREAQQLLVPPPRCVNKRVAQKLDELMRQGDLMGALDLGDEAFLVEACGWEPARVTSLRSAWIRLRDRRSRRGRSNGSTLVDHTLHSSSELVGDEGI
jgi:adenine-specific DNA methylase